MFSSAELTILNYTEARTKAVYSGGPHIRAHSIEHTEGVVRNILLNM